MNVVLDGGNGMAGPMCGPILDELSIEQVPTYWEPASNTEPLLRLNLESLRSKEHMEEKRDEVLALRHG